MNNFWVKNKYRIIGAVGLAVLYLCIVGAWWVLTGAQGGERFGFLLAFLNFPLLIIPILTGWHSNSVMTTVLFYGLGGTLLYALIGWFLGPILERLDLEDQKKREKNNKEK